MRTWICTGCGHFVETVRGYRSLMRLAAAHLADCTSALFEDVDGYYAPDACLDPYLRPTVRRVRKIMFLRAGRNKTLHIDYGAEITPCGMQVADPRFSEVRVANFYGGQYTGLRLCKTCLKYRRPTVVEEMRVLTAEVS